ncbi:MAG: hypothetical protein QM682_06310 [Paracoccus sp. (in: a-proteobacteria)]|uniref:hypothetical protein n=1 Tax=Paracoccus sp. TaxID=267 RepID=UPI0039E28E33
MDVDQLAGMAKTYADHSGLKLSTVAAYAVNDGKFFDRIEKGGGCTLRTAKRLIDFLADRWPSDLAWPRDIPRPPKSKEAA